MRRPPGIPARASAESGDPEFFPSPSPATPVVGTDCETPARTLWSVALDRVRFCLAAIDSGEISWRLIRDPQPFWQLQNAEETPECIRTELAEIPVPREIIFESDAEGHATCYSANIDLEADRVAGIRLPWRRLNLTLRFPIPSHQHPVDDRAMLGQLISWAVEPFWDSDLGTRDSPRVISARVLSRSFCETCVGASNLMRPGLDAPVRWP